LSAERQMREAADLLAQAQERLARAQELCRHAMAFWTREMRDATKPCPPSELPDSKLGPALAKVRDYLRPAPGKPPDPLFDKMIGAIGLDAARLYASTASDAEPVALWDGLLDYARRRNPAGMERAE
jgi:hypothetical protein